jgi:putative GTP pyrophosphokinase
MVNYSLDRLAKELVEEIQNELNRAGIMHRIFFRCKDPGSINLKMEKKGYDGIGSFLRDLIGIRINVYFVDDIHIVSQRLLSLFIKRDESIDIINQTEFKPTRINYVFELPQQHKREFAETITDTRIDCTFELQLRTVLSEGWHEVEHDLRYKQQDHWENHGDLGRILNGVLASLETNDWSMLSLLDKLSYRHYRARNWDAMIRTKLRLRLDSTSVLDERIVSLFEQQTELAKSIFKLDRSLLLKDLFESDIKFPLIINNVVFFINARYFGDITLYEYVPEPMRRVFNQISQTEFIS